MGRRDTVTLCIFHRKLDKFYISDTCKPADWTDINQNAADTFVEEIFREEIEREQDSE